MQGLTPGQITAWLSSHGQIEDPYLSDRQPLFRVQCYAPRAYQATECFVEVICDQLMNEGELLVHITDAFPSKPCRDLMTTALRREFGEERSIEDAPGFLAQRSEMWHAVALFSLCCCFEWKGYVYGIQNQMTLYNWEGEILDFWTDSEIKRDQFREIMRNFKLEEVEDEPEVEGTE
jgi:hypothetical protein